MNGLTIVVIAIGMLGWSLVAVAVAGSIAGPLVAKRYPHPEAQESSESPE